MFARTSTLDPSHCPLDPRRLDRRNHPALNALQVHLVLGHPEGIRILRQRADDQVRVGARETVQHLVELRVHAASLPLVLGRPEVS